MPQILGFPRTRLQNLQEALEFPNILFFFCSLAAQETPRSDIVYITAFCHWLKLTTILTLNSRSPHTVIGSRFKSVIGMIAGGFSLLPRLAPSPGALFGLGSVSRTDIYQKLAALYSLRKHTKPPATQARVKIEGLFFVIGTFKIHFPSSYNCSNKFGLYFIVNLHTALWKNSSFTLYS